MQGVACLCTGPLSLIPPFTVHLYSSTSDARHTAGTAFVLVHSGTLLFPFCRAAVQAGRPCAAQPVGQTQTKRVWTDVSPKETFQGELGRSQEPLKKSRAVEKVPLRITRCGLLLPLASLLDSSYLITGLPGSFCHPAADSQALSSGTCGLPPTFTPCSLPARLQAAGQSSPRPAFEPPPPPPRAWQEQKGLPRCAHGSI